MVNDPFGKFQSLMEGELRVKDEAITKILSSKDLSMHSEAVEKSADLIHYFIHSTDLRGDDDYAVRCLGIRTFNALASSLSLLLRGYYQVAAGIQRDLLETAFLLDYFSTDPALVTQWRTGSDDDRKRHFSPDAIRKTLDARDRYSGRRKQSYDMLCQVAAHPRPRGFEMLKMDDNSAHCGPFLRDVALLATLSELAKTAIVAASNFGALFTAETIEDWKIVLTNLEFNTRWFADYYGAKFDQTEIAAIRRQLALLEVE